jgi:hypothetical protein
MRSKDADAYQERQHAERQAELNAWLVELRALAADLPLTVNTVASVEKRFKGLAGYDEAVELVEALRSQFKAREAANRAQADAERQRWADEKAAWINAHGSETLRAKFNAGYNCQWPYVMGRAKMEYPRYTVDWQDSAEWKPRSTPGDAAFAEAQRVGGTVVWLTAPAQSEIKSDDPGDYGFDDPAFEECEAVVIEGYLGKYDLVREM